MVRGENLYGRGAADDKGQLFAHVKALECYLRTVGELPVNVRCLFEGEEEIGSANFDPFPRRHREALAAGLAVIFDMPILGPDRPAITYSMRVASRPGRFSGFAFLHPAHEVGLGGSST